MNARYLVDNPFRLLGVPSGTPMAELRRQATTISRARQAGLAGDVLLADLFGQDGIETIDSQVRALTSDPVLRTAYRYLWPATKEGVAALRSSEDSPDAQVTAVRAMVAFYREPTVRHLRKAVNRFGEAAASEELGAVLAGLLVTEEGIDAERAAATVEQACAKVEEGVVETAGSVAAAEIEEGRETDGYALLDVMLTLNGDGALMEAALRPVVRVGETWISNFEAARDDVVEAGGLDWSPGWTDPLMGPATRIRSLAAKLRGKHPIALTWLASVQEWVDAQAVAIRKYALDRCNDHEDFEGARRAIDEARLLPVSRDMDVMLAKDLTILQVMEEDSNLRTALAGTLPIGRPPTMYTLNGIGTMFYRTGPFWPRPDAAYGILYFTVVFLPIFPIGRYIVEEAKPRGYYFLAKTRWTTWMRVHLAVGLLLTTWMAYCISTIPPSSSSDHQSSLDSNYVPYPEPDLTPLSDGAKDNTVLEPGDLAKIKADLDRGVEALKVDKWRKERDALNRHIATDEKALRAEGKKLDDEKEGLNVAHETLDLTSVMDVDDYNKRVEAYERARKKLKKHLQAYDARCARSDELTNWIAHAEGRQ